MGGSFGLESGDHAVDGAPDHSLHLHGGIDGHLPQTQSDPMRSGHLPGGFRMPDQIVYIDNEFIGHNIDVKTGTQNPGQQPTGGQTGTSGGLGLA
jgi:hypothetical protein